MSIRHGRSCWCGPARGTGNGSCRCRRRSIPNCWRTSWNAAGDAGRCCGPRSRARLFAKHICEVVCHAAEQAGIAREVTPKALRHSYATHLMDRGVDLAVIAKLMGHRSPAETGVYLHVLKDRPQRAVNPLDLSGGDAA